MALAHAGLRGSFPEEHDWGELAFYLAFFVWGYYSFEAVSMTVLFSANASAWALAAPGLGMRVGRFGRPCRAASGSLRLLLCARGRRAPNALTRVSSPFSVGAPARGTASAGRGAPCRA